MWETGIPEHMVSLYLFFKQKLYTELRFQSNTLFSIHFITP